jgi:hypothetical protein
VPFHFSDFTGRSLLVTFTASGGRGAPPWSVCSERCACWRDAAAGSSDKSFSVYTARIAIWRANPDIKKQPPKPEGLLQAKTFTPRSSGDRPRKSASRRGPRDNAEFDRRLSKNNVTELIAFKR